MVWWIRVFSAMTHYWRSFWKNQQSHCNHVCTNKLLLFGGQIGLFCLINTLILFGFVLGIMNINIVLKVRWFLLNIYVFDLKMKIFILCEFCEVFVRFFIFWLVRWFLIVWFSMIFVTLMIFNLIRNFFILIVVFWVNIFECFVDLLFVKLKIIYTNCNNIQIKTRYNRIFWIYRYKKSK